MATIVVTGFNTLQREIARSGPAVSKAMRQGLRDAAEPVKADAERLARSEIPRMNATRLEPPPWSVTRLGITSREVYLVPRERGARGRGNRRRRPNFAVLMMGRAFEPALEWNEKLVSASVDAWLTEAIEAV